jgi:hypothetical protein
MTACTADRRIDAKALMNDDAAMLTVRLNAPAACHAPIQTLSFLPHAFREHLYTRRQAMQQLLMCEATQTQ